jgi:hypothetical protein
VRKARRTYLAVVLALLTVIGLLLLVAVILLATNYPWG